MTSVVPRFRDLLEASARIWHECKDLALAAWLSWDHRLKETRRSRDVALRIAYAKGISAGAEGHEVDVLHFELASHRYLGRLCSFDARRKGKPIA